jgi:WD40 repeat protein
VWQTVKCWSLSNGHQRWSVKYDPVHWACSLSLSSGANLLATASLDNTIALYRVKNGQLLRQLRVHQDGIMCMRFLTDDVLVLGSTTGKVHLLQL